MHACMTDWNFAHVIIDDGVPLSQYFVTDKSAMCWSLADNRRYVLKLCKESSSISNTDKNP